MKQHPELEVTVLEVGQLAGAAVAAPLARNEVPVRALREGSDKGMMCLDVRELRASRRAYLGGTEGVEREGTGVG